MEVSRSLLARTEEFVLVPSFRRRPESSPPSFPRKAGIHSSPPRGSTESPTIVIPAKAGIHFALALCFGFRRFCEDRLTSVCVSSTIPGRRLLSFACPKESNQRIRAPSRPRFAGRPALQTPRAGCGVRRQHVLVLTSNSPASCRRSLSRLFLRLLAAAERDPGRARQSLPQKQDTEERRGEPTFVVPAKAGTQRLCFALAL